MQSSTDTDDKGIGAVGDVVHRFVTYWETLDWQALAELWDHAGDVTYMAPEIDDILVGWETIASHLARTRSRLVNATIEMPRSRFRLITGDVAVAIFIVRWRMQSVESDVVRETAARVTAILRRRGSQWRIVHYMEESYFLPECAEASHFLEDLESPFR